MIGMDWRDEFKCGQQDSPHMLDLRMCHQEQMKSRLQSLAEEVGFEPTVELPPRRFSRPVHSSTLSLLRATIATSEREEFEPL